MGTTRRIDWIELVIQVTLVAAGVAPVAGRYALAEGAFRSKPQSTG
jgi:hypothetical protein